MIRTYAYCDAALVSALEFPELPVLLRDAAVSVSPPAKCSAERSSITFEPHTESLDANADWRLRWEFPDKSAMVYRNESGGPHLYRFDSVHGPRFFISSDGKRVEFETGFGDVDTVRHLLIDQVLPRIRSRQGALMMHAACIETPSGAMAIFGESGQGKSTLSFALQEAGCRVLSDDCAKFELRSSGGNEQVEDARVENINGVYATSTYPSLRLWPDVLSALSVDDRGSIPVAGYNTKRRINVTGVNVTGVNVTGVNVTGGNVTGGNMTHIDVTQTLARQPAMAPVQVAIGIVLGGRNENGPSFEPMPKGKAMLEMVKQTFHLDVRERDIQQRSFQQVDELVRALPTFHLAYPAGLESMPNVAQFVIERVAACIKTSP